jgi:hypothetical protein
VDADLFGEKIKIEAKYWAKINIRIL